SFFAASGHCGNRKRYNDCETLQNGYTVVSEEVNMMRLGIPPLLAMFVVLAVSAVVLIWPAARICRRAGFSSWFGILIIVPLANLFLFWFVAVAEWPNLPASRRVTP